MKFYIEGTQHLIDNYDKAKADNFKDWVIHHRLAFNEKYEYVNSRQDLIDKDLYYYRPPEELIYLLNWDHVKLHNATKEKRAELMSKFEPERKYENYIPERKYENYIIHKNFVEFMA